MRILYGTGNKAKVEAMKKIISNIDKYHYTYHCNSYNKKEVSKLINLFRSR